MERLVYHDPCDPQYDAVERYAKFYDDECCCKKEKEYHIYLFRSQLTSDFEFSLNIMTRGRRNEGNQDNTLEMIEKFRPMLNRWIDKYVSYSKSKMSRVIVEKIQKGVSDFAGSKDEIDITIKMGEWWNENALSILANAIHDYVVNGMMYEYLVLSVTEKDPVTQSKKTQLELSLDDIKNAVNSYKPDKIRKKFHPFP